MYEDNVRIHFIGQIDGLPESLQKQMRDAEDLMKANTGVRFNVAANYGGQDELVRAVRSIAGKVASGALNPEDIGEDTVEANLDTRGNLPVDLVIRTSGDQRLSNFCSGSPPMRSFGSQRRIGRILPRNVLWKP